MSFAELVSIAGDALSDDAPEFEPAWQTALGGRAPELLALLQLRNGFYAFESALHVLAADSTRRVIGLAQWNADTNWRTAFGRLAHGCFFFAEDLVGGQFCIYNSEVHKFDPETGQRTLLAPTLATWSQVMLDGYREQTLWPLAHEWQLKNGPLRPGQRLVPKVPFVLGGDYTVDNLYPMDASKAMRYYANLALQIQDVPDGATIRLEVTD